MCRRRIEFSGDPAISFQKCDAVGVCTEMLLLAFALADRVGEGNAKRKIAAIAFEAQEGIIITDDEEKIIQVNRAFSEITGFKARCDR